MCTFSTDTQDVSWDVCRSGIVNMPKEKKHTKLIRAYYTTVKHSNKKLFLFYLNKKQMTCAIM